MELVRIYECLCDATRLRILHLLTEGPLCVCHFQTILQEPQVKISKHLGYLKARGMVEVRREGTWRVYSLVTDKSRELTGNLACLQDCAQEEPQFRSDLERLRKVQARVGDRSPACCGRGKKLAPMIHRRTARPSPRTRNPTAQT
ncbi:MAG: metalloregulator ArsR/SmtB family transcription factor [Opitutus sp.]